MRTQKHATMLAALALTAGCGGGGDDRDEEPEEAPMRVEDTVVGDLVTAPGRVEDRTNAAMDRHRESLESRLDADEGAPPEEEAPED